MLNLTNLCRTPVGPLRPTAPAHEIQVPMADVTAPNIIQLSSRHIEFGFYDVQGQVWRLPHNNNRPIWRLGPSQWQSGTEAEWWSLRGTLPAIEEWATVKLPDLPVLPPSPQPVPRAIHQIWIGDRMPEQSLIDCMTRNAKNAEDFSLTLHTDVSDELFARLQPLLNAAVPRLQVEKLQHSVFFELFKKSELYPHYLTASTGAITNFAASSDMLRFPLSNHYGGLYMDLDDYFIDSTNGIALFADPNDLLLGSTVSKTDANFNGYNSSHFATLPNNPVLAKITEEMARRCELNADFFKKPRPPLEQGALTSPYAATLFNLTGPGVLNDVLARERPDYYSTLFHLTAHSLERQYGVYDQVYVEKLVQVSDHYFPFARKLPIEIGSTESWATH